MSYPPESNCLVRVILFTVKTIDSMLCRIKNTSTSLTLVPYLLFCAGEPGQPGGQVHAEDGAECAGGGRRTRQGDKVQWLPAGQSLQQ